MSKIKAFLLSIFILIYSGLASQELIDKKATKETKSLYKSLYLIGQEHTLFGQQHATEYGHHWKGDKNRSDVKSVCGSHPAVIGVDLLKFYNGSPEKIAKERALLSENIIENYNRGAVNTLAWHFSNPFSKDKNKFDFYWKDSISEPILPRLIPGGDGHEKYKTILNEIGEWVKTLKGKHGEAIPIIFRPYHEFDGDWFWWGKPHCSKEEFITMWRFTVSYMRDTLKLHNIIYAFSPDCKFNTEEEYLDRYPGDEWVDLLGMDDYHDFKLGDLEAVAKKLKIVSDYAIKKKKLAAFTETGLESIPDPIWWTDKLLPIIKREDIKLCYVLVWRNDEDSPTHYYAPFPNQVSAENFVAFYNDSHVLFENDLKHIYNRRWWKFWLRRWRSK
ncbi:glycosyl hydrolase [uncultured Algibacter sp.]|uniref:glycoside hydrolase family 26 protein n=1 Tax=uncultured Algibacter sp. TaxID=298659 RepID=UPI00261997A3|nr:glycosyl hydrolase [uncultured Algibacter sp.]